MPNPQTPIFQTPPSQALTSQTPGDLPLHQLDVARNTSWRLFLTAHARVIEKIELELAAIDAPPLAWYDVLLTLWEAPNHKMRLHELAHKVLLSRSNLTRLVDRLESAGLICRERCPNDRRGAYAVLTKAGCEMRARMWPPYAQGIAQYFGAQLSDDEVEVLTRVYRRILGSLEQ